MNINNPESLMAIAHLLRTQNSGLTMPLKPPSKHKKSPDKI